MKKHKIDIVRAKVKELFDANNSVIITSSDLQMILGFRCTCHTKRLCDEENVLVLMREVKVGKTYVFEYSVNPSADWNEKPKFNPGEWCKQQREKEARRLNAGLSLQHIIGSWGNHAA